MTKKDSNDKNSKLAKVFAERNNNKDKAFFLLSI